MRTYRYSWWWLVVGLAGRAWASEWIVETPEAWVATGRFRAGSDGADVAVVDRASGLARVGRWDAVGDAYRWEEQAVGMAGITGFAVLRGGAMDRWVATGPEWNALQFVEPGTPPGTRVSAVAAPRGLAWSSWGRETGMEVEGVVTFSDFGETAAGGRFGAVTESGAVRFEAATAERYGRVMGLTLGAAPAVPIVVGQHAGGLRVGRMAADGWSAAAFEVAVEPGREGGTGFVWAAAEASIYVCTAGESRLRQHELAGTDVGGGFRLASGVSWTADHALPGPVVGLDAVPLRDPQRPGLRHGLVLRYVGAPDRPRLYRVEGTPPVFQEVAELALPAGEGFTGVVGAGDGFVVLSGTGRAVVSWQRFGVAGADGVPVRLAGGTVPPLARGAGRPNLFLFDQDPFLKADAVLLGSERRLDWTVVDGGFVVGETDGGAIAGLGSPSRLGPVDPGRVGMGNQLLAGASVAGFGPLGGPLRTEVTLEPPPGRHAARPAGQRFRVDLRGTSPTGGEIRYRRSGDTEWQRYDAAVGVPLEADDVIMAYQETAGIGGRSKVAVGAYRFGALPPVEPVPGVDVDGDGLSDAWEQAFGVRDPDSDSDGDGTTARQEYAAGTDPTDAGSRPAGGGGGLPAIEVGRDEGGRLRLAWAGGVGAVVLEVSDDLVGWEPVSPQPTGNDWAVEAEGVGRFFRLRRTGVAMGAASGASIGR